MDKQLTSSMTFGGMIPVHLTRIEISINKTLKLVTSVMIIKLSNDINVIHDKIARNYNLLKVFSKINICPNSY